MSKTIFGARVAIARTSKGINQTELANAIRTSPSRISNLEAGRNEPSIEFAIRIADALDISLDYLTGRSDGDEQMQRRTEIMAQIEALKAQLA